MLIGLVPCGFRGQMKILAFVTLLLPALLCANQNILQTDQENVAVHFSKEEVENLLSVVFGDDHQNESLPENGATPVSNQPLSTTVNDSSSSKRKSVFLPSATTSTGRRMLAPAPAKHGQRRGALSWEEILRFDMIESEIQCIQIAQGTVYHFSWIHSMFMTDRMLFEQNTLAKCAISLLDRQARLNTCLRQKKSLPEWSAEKILEKVAQIADQRFLVEKAIKILQYVQASKSSILQYVNFIASQTATK